MTHFDLFGTTHLLTLTAIAGCFVAAWLSHRHLSPRAGTATTLTLALGCLLSHPVHLLCAALSDTNLSLENTFPFHLCDITAIVCGMALLTRHSQACEFAYFWGLSATTQGLLTPNIMANFPDPMYVSFFWNHGFIVISALFLPIALKWRPAKGALWRVFIGTQVYTAFAMILNAVLKTNYGFLAAKPRTASLLDFFPDWPWYILFLELLCLALFFILSLPFSKKSEK